MLLIGGAGLVAVFMLKGTSGSGSYQVKDIHGNLVGNFSSLASAEQVAGTWGQSSGNTVWQNGIQIGGASVYNNPSSGSDGGGGGGIDWGAVTTAATSALSYVGL